MKVILVSFLLFGLALADLTCDCGKRNTGRSTGGKETKKNEYPWMVALQSIYSAQTFCGGTIVTPWHVITASHCVEDVIFWQLVLVVGATDINDRTDITRQELLVDAVLMHPNYDNVTKANDLAIIQTSSDIIFNQNVGPACIPKTRLMDELIGQMVKVIGWGTDNFITKVMKTKLMEIDLQVKAVSGCDGGQGSKLCTFSLGKDPCRGDSGGPVVWLDPDVNRFTLVGVVSYGPTACGLTLDHSTQTNLAFYKDWVNDSISNMMRGAVKTCRKV